MGNSGAEASAHPRTNRLDLGCRTRHKNRMRECLAGFGAVANTMANILRMHMGRPDGARGRCLRAGPSPVERSLGRRVGRKRASGLLRLFFFPVLRIAVFFLVPFLTIWLVGGSPGFIATRFRLLARLSGR